MTPDDDERDRTCALCHKRIADECPGTLEHVVAQRDHYWWCLNNLEKAFDRMASRKPKP